MFNNYVHQLHPLSAKAQAYQARNLKARATRAANVAAKRDAYLADPARAQLIADLNAANVQQTGFIANMVEAFNEWGNLTEKQEAATRSVLVKRAEQAAQRKAENAADAKSVHVGKIGERRDFALTLVKAFPYHSQFGEAFVQTLKDGEGNVFVYFGQKLHGELYSVNPGDRIVVKATIKAHDQRDGVAQTIINRPKVLDVFPAREREPNVEDLS